MHKSEDLIQNHKEFLNQTREMLRHFGIKTTNLTLAGITRRKDGTNTKGIEFEILGTKKSPISIINFQKKIGFETNYKKEKLNKAIGNILNAPVSPRILGKAQLG